MKGIETQNGSKASNPSLLENQVTLLYSLASTLHNCMLLQQSSIRLKIAPREMSLWAVSNLSEKVIKYISLFLSPVLILAQQFF
jgi:hypothetical protein